MSEVFATDTSFADLGLTGALLENIEKRGFKHPTHIQAQLLPVVLSGNDALGQAKTGTGKTAAFGLPILQQVDPTGPLQALVLAPTRELALQIVREMREWAASDIRIACIVGGERYGKQLDALEKGAQIAVGTPGRVMDLHQKKKLPFDKLRWAVLDEVDRMLDIGFREDIRKILSKIKCDHQTVFVSATISEEIDRLARRFMKDNVQKIVTTSAALTVSQVTQHYLPIHWKDKKRLLVHLLKHEEPALTVVFCKMKSTVRDVTRFLNDKQIEAFEIHGDLPQGKRNRIMERLRSGKLEVLVASDLAARGLDVEGITHIINFDLPEDPEVYVHRIGRTARAGRSGVAWSFVEPDEGQRLTEIEKLTGVLIEKKDYDDFVPKHDPFKAKPKEDEGEIKRERYTQTVNAGTSDGDGPDPNLFPGGVVPKGPPPKSLGSRLRSRRGKR